MEPWAWAEAIFITEKHRVDIEFIEILKMIEGSLNYILYPMGVAVVLKCHELKKRMCLDNHKIAQIYTRFLC